jgi:hypothetical protein
LLATFIVAVFWVLPTLAATSGINSPASDVKTGLGKLLACHWQGTDTLAVCPVKRINGLVSLSRDPTGKTIETIEMNALIASHPGPRLADEKLSRDTVARIVAYLLPDWKNESVWLRNALNEAAHFRSGKVANIGNVTVLVQWLQPADVADTFATIVVTKKVSIDDWKWGDETE